MYKLINTETNKEVLSNIFIHKIKNFQFEYAKALCNSLGIDGDRNYKIVEYLLNNVDKDYRIHGTYISLAHDMRLSAASVAVMFRTLRDNDLISKVRNGCYLLDKEIFPVNGAVSVVVIKSDQKGVIL